MGKLLELLHQDHINITRLLDLLENQVRLLEENKHANLQLLRDIVDYIMNYPDLYHHPREDLVFELLRHRDKEIVPVINHLLGEHKILTETSINLAEMLGNIKANDREQIRILADLLQKYVNLSRSHMDIEESSLFPCADRVLTKEDWTEIEKGCTYKDDPLFGKVIYQQYQHIYDSIVKQEQGGR